MTSKPPNHEEHIRAIAEHFGISELQVSGKVAAYERFGTGMYARVARYYSEKFEIDNLEAYRLPEDTP